MTAPIGRAPSNGHTSSLSLDTYFDLLADKWRRHLLYYFADTTAHTVTVDELVTHLVHRVDTAASLGKKRVNTELRHKHLPKLAAVGVIDYDMQAETVHYYWGTELEEVVAFAARMEQTL
ncbi:DUF7344 domain-containing protein [Haladaptatus sp. NG-WS-4]